MRDFKAELNAAQYSVVSHADGPVLVLAGAGSGKTRTLVYRVAYLLEKGVRPDRILLLTFTNKAANEMLSRVRELVGDEKKAAKIWGGTYHHVAHRLLRRMGSAVGLKPNFTILDREDSKDLLKRTVKQLAGGSSKRRLPLPGVFQDVLSYAVNAQTSVSDALAKKYPDGFDLAPIFETAVKFYEQRKKLANSVDFDDLLLLWLRLLQSPAAHDKLVNQWEYILVDEYQDTNTVQAAIVCALASKNRNILVVGDDAQSIYSFRAADIKNILSFPTVFPGAKVFKLEENYRSTPEILNVANGIIAFNTDQFKKTLFTSQDSFVKPELSVLQDTAEEATHIADRIMALEDESVSLGAIAVLFRAAHQSQPLEFELNARRIPYEMRGGLRFFERAHIKDVLAYLRIFGNISDEAAWFRVLELHDGIGEATASRLVSELRERTDVAEALRTRPNMSGAALVGWKTLAATLTGVARLQKETPGAIIRALAPHYKRYAELQFTDFKDRLDDIEQLALFAEGYDDLNAFLAVTALQEAYVMRPSAERGSEAKVVLSTIHQAKGLEWNAVFVMQMTAHSLPHPRALFEEGGLEEERRLFYVAITRARRRLFFTYPLSGSRHNLSLHQPSQFLRELDPKLVTGLESRTEDEYISIGDDGEKSYLPSIEKL